MTVDEKANVIIDVDGKMAGQKIDELTKKSKELRKALHDAALKNDKAEWDRLKRSIDENDKEVKKIKASMYDLQKVLNNLNGSSIKDLERAQRQLRTEIKTTVATSKEEQAALKQKAAQLDNVNRKLDQMRKEYKLGGTISQSFYSKVANGLNKYFLAATAAVASFTGLIMVAKKAISTYAEWDDKLADVMKTTQLTRLETVWLNEELKKIKTRSAQLELLDLARVAGKLGIQGKDNILGFVSAADKIKVSLSEDLGGDIEESINQIGKLTDIFKLQQKYGYEEAMIKTGSAINALGAASTANEGYLVEFTKRVAGVAPSAKISIENVLGLAATLDMLGQTSEVSSTVYSQVVPDMFDKTAEYAKVAGMSVEDFSKLLNEDANEAFIKTLEGLKGNNEGMQHLVKMLDLLGVDGKRSISVLGVLANNIDTLRDQQQLANVEFEKGTSLINEFNTKNNTMQARLDRAKKSLYNVTVELGQKLAPALVFSTNSASYLIKGLNNAIDVIKLMAGVTEDATEAFDKQVMKVYDLKTQIEPLLSRYDDLASKSKLSKDEQTELNSIIKTVAETVPSAVTAFDEYGEALSISTQRAREFINTEMDRLKVVNAEAIRENEKALKKLENQIKYHKVNIDQIAKGGYFTITETTGTSGISITRKSTEEEIKQEEEKYKNLLSQKRGYQAEIKRLNGDALKEEMDRRQEEMDRRQEEITLAEEEKKKLEQLAKDEADAKAAAVDSAKSAYEKLQEAIKKTKEKIQELLLAGNMEEAMKTGLVLKNLEDSIDAIDYFINSKGDIDAAFDKVRQPFIDKGISDIKDVEPLDLDYSVDPLPVNAKPIEPTGFDAMDPDEKRDWAIEQAETVSNAVFDIWRNRADARYEYELNLLNKQMEKELSNKSLTEEQKDRIREKYAAKERKIKKEQFRKQKTADIIQSIINTALAVVKALPNAPLAIAAGIAGAAQTAVIASQPIPQFYYGGDTGPGIGIKDNNGPIAGLVHAREYVIPEWMRKIPQVIAFERVMEGIRTTRGYFKGGRTSPDSDPPLSTESPDDNLKVSDVLIKLYNILKAGIKAKLVYQEFKEFEAKVEKIENKAKIN